MREKRIKWLCRFAAILAVRTGCAHNGIMNILQTIGRRFPGETIAAVFGGTHLLPPVPERIKKTAAFLESSGIGCAGVCHCTGADGVAAFRRRVPGYPETGAGFCWQTND